MMICKRTLKTMNSYLTIALVLTSGSAALPTTPSDLMVSLQNACEGEQYSLCYGSSKDKYSNCGPQDSSCHCQVLFEVATACTANCAVGTASVDGISEVLSAICHTDPSSGTALTSQHFRWPIWEKESHYSSDDNDDDDDASYWDDDDDDDDCDNGDDSDDGSQWHRPAQDYDPEYVEFDQWRDERSQDASSEAKLTKRFFSDSLSNLHERVNNEISSFKANSEANAKSNNQAEGYEYQLENYPLHLNTPTPDGLYKSIAVSNYDGHQFSGSNEIDRFHLDRRDASSELPSSFHILLDTSTCTEETCACIDNVCISKSQPEFLQNFGIIRDLIEKKRQKKKALKDKLLGDFKSISECGPDCESLQGKEDSEKQVPSEEVCDPEFSTCTNETLVSDPEYAHELTPLPEPECDVANPEAECEIEGDTEPEWDSEPISDLIPEIEPEIEPVPEQENDSVESSPYFDGSDCVSNSDNDYCSDAPTSATLFPTSSAQSMSSDSSLKFSNSAETQTAELSTLIEPTAIHLTNTISPTTSTDSSLTTDFVSTTSTPEPSSVLSSSFYELTTTNSLLYATTVTRGRSHKVVTRTIVIQPSQTELSSVSQPSAVLAEHFSFKKPEDQEDLVCENECEGEESDAKDNCCRGQPEQNKFEGTLAKLYEKKKKIEGRKKAMLHNIHHDEDCGLNCIEERVEDDDSEQCDDPSYCPFGENNSEGVIRRILDCDNAQCDDNIGSCSPEQSDCIVSQDVQSGTDYLSHSVEERTLVTAQPKNNNSEITALMVAFKGNNASINVTVSPNISISSFNYAGSNGSTNAMGSISRPKGASEEANADYSQFERGTATSGSSVLREVSIRGAISMIICLLPVVLL